MRAAEACGAKNLALRCTGTEIRRRRQQDQGERERRHVFFSATSISAQHLNVFFQQQILPSAFQLQLASFHLFPIVIFDSATLVGRLGRAFKVVPLRLAPPLRCTKFLRRRARFQENELYMM